MSDDGAGKAAGFKAWELQAIKFSRAEGESLGMSLGDGNVKSSYQVVTAVVADSVASNAGVQEGDVLLTVDGKSATNTSHDAVVTLLKATGNDVAITFGRPDKAADFVANLSEITPLMNEAPFPSVGLGTWKVSCNISLWWGGERKKERRWKQK